MTWNDTQDKIWLHGSLVSYTHHTRLNVYLWHREKGWLFRLRKLGITQTLKSTTHFSKCCLKFKIVWNFIVQIWCHQHKKITMFKNEKGFSQWNLWNIWYVYYKVLGEFVINLHEVGTQNKGLYILIVISEKGLAQNVRACWQSQLMQEQLLQGDKLARVNYTWSAMFLTSMPSMLTRPPFEDRNVILWFAPVWNTKFPSWVTILGLQKEIKSIRETINYILIIRCASEDNKSLTV